MALWYYSVFLPFIKCGLATLLKLDIRFLLLSIQKFTMTAQMARVVKAFASGTVDLGLIPSRVKPMTLKLVFTASCLTAQH